MTVPMALLALLGTAESAHGFALKKQYDALLGRERELKFGQVYSTLARLERDGLAEGVGFAQASAAERRLYAITSSGVTEVDTWLRTPQLPGGRPTELFTKVILALASGRSAGEILDAQREVHLRRMRELTQQRAEGDVVDRLARDFALTHLEADLQWVELAGKRMDQLASRIDELGARR